MVARQSHQRFRGLMIPCATGAPLEPPSPSASPPHQSPLLLRSSLPSMLALLRRLKNARSSQLFVAMLVLDSSFVESACAVLLLLLLPLLLLVLLSVLQRWRR